MNKKGYKVEAKGSLFEVSIASGCYSDYRNDIYVFSGNSIEEVWVSVKKWAKDSGLGDTYKLGLIYGDEKFEIGQLPEWKSEIDWSTSYGDACNVDISRLNVIYVDH